MSAIMEVPFGHPLHAMYTFWEMLPLGDDQVTCLHIGHAVLYLRHHGKEEAASAQLADEQYQWQPVVVYQNVLAKKVPEPNIKIVLKAVEMMEAIVMHQVERKSAFVKAFRSRLQRMGDPPPGEVEFRIYSAAQEMIFSSGAQFKHWVEPVRGFHCYAEILAKAHKAIITRASIDSAKFFRFATEFERFQPAETKSLLVVADSQGKFFSSITGGRVVAVSGGNFGHIMQVLSPDDIEWRSYRWVMVDCSTNCRANSRYQETQREFQWRNLHDMLMQEADRRGRGGSIVFCTSFEHPCVGVAPGLADRIEKEFRDTGVQCINWRSLGNPFVGPDGMPIQALYDTFNKRTAYAKQAEIHLNHADLNLLWKTWARFIPELKFLPMTLSSKPLTVPKFLLQECLSETVVETARSPSSVSSRIGASFTDVGTCRSSNSNRRDGRNQSSAHISVGEDSRPSTSGVKRAADARDEQHDQNGAHGGPKEKRERHPVDLNVVVVPGRESSECRVYYSEEKAHDEN